MLYSFKIEQAIRAAAVLHDGQTRKGVEPYPYVTHLISVAFMLSDYGANEETIVAGLLHDTLEDTNYTPEELEADFGSNVREIVEGVTDALHAEREQYTWKQRQERYLKTLALAPKPSLMIAAADKIHNMRSIVEEYSDRPALFFKHFGRSIDDLTEKYNALKLLFHERLDGGIVKEYDHVHALFETFLTSARNEETYRAPSHS
jgi:(p)ppGpp synthase/HD superfamily hydrolase